MDINKISGSIIETAMRVHSALGPGLLERAYEACLMHELRNMGLKASFQLALSIV
jgi:GxxExxY protein